MARKSKEAMAAKKAKQTMWLTALYIRLSREDGNSESYSVINQKQRLTAYFDSIALEESMQLVDIYVDDGFTGTDSNRDDFQRMLSDLDDGKINCIIVKDLSRLSRNDWECKRYLQHLFVVKDVRFISLELPRLDSYKRPDEIYELGVTMQSTYNENHCRETSIKVRGTFNAKRRAGEFIGAFAPYGYAKDPNNKHKLVIDEQTAPVVRDIFHWFVREGMSKAGIVKKLSELGVPCPAAYKRQSGMKYQNPHVSNNPIWSTGTITHMLKNQMYLGHMVQGRQKVKSYKVHTQVKVPEKDWFIVYDMHAPIIDQLTFDQVQSLLLRDTRTAPHSGKLYPFSGFLRCADCGKSMGRRTSSKSQVYYACKTYVTTHLCSRHSIRHDRLENIVLTAIARQIDLIDGLNEMIDEITQAPVQRTTSKRLESSLKSRKNELEKTSALRMGLYVDWKSGDITREEYHRLKLELEQKEARLKQDLAKLEEEIHDIAQGVSHNPCFEAFRKHKAFTELSREIVVDLIEAIHIHEGGDVDIAFNFADQHQWAIGAGFVQAYGAHNT